MSKEVPKVPEFYYLIKNSTSVLLFPYFIIAPTVAAFSGKIEAATVMAAVGACAIVLTRLRDLESLSFFSMSAKLREATNKAENAAHDAEVTAESLRKLAVTLAEGDLRSFLMLGNLGKNWTYTVKFAHFKNVMDSLHQVGCNDGQLNEVRNLWITYTKRLVTNSISRKILENDDVSIKEKWNEIHTSLVKEDSIPADVFKNFLHENKISDQELLERINDYENFLKTGLLEKPDVIPANAQI